MAFLAKPGVPRSVHLFAAPFLWTVIGGWLMLRGWGWLEPGRGRLLFVAAMFLGTLKSLFILDKVAQRSLDRIIRFQDDTCLGAVYSWKTWLLVLLMMTAGIVLRGVTQPGPYIGTLYAAIGWSLCLSSRLGWRAWRRWQKPKET
ncbi:MAG: hypothetical protein LBH14_06555 [Desulfobulbaceae bacterium]|jgi:hypothetical protein|nr:hypothetical protein [Desulfobulbaceae bacterium]